MAVLGGCLGKRVSVESPWHSVMCQLWWSAASLLSFAQRDQAARFTLLTKSLVEGRRVRSGRPTLWAPALAAMSTYSFPLSPRWEGTHWYLTLTPFFLRDEVSPWMIDSSSGRDLQYSLDSMSSKDLESESTVTVFGGDFVMYKYRTWRSPLQRRWQYFPCTQTPASWHCSWLAVTIPWYWLVIGVDLNTGSSSSSVEFGTRSELKRYLQASLPMQCHSGRTPASLYTLRCGTPLGSPRASLRAVHSTAASLCMWPRGRLKRAWDSNRSLLRTRLKRWCAWQPGFFRTKHWGRSKADGAVTPAGGRPQQHTASWTPACSCP